MITIRTIIAFTFLIAGTIRPACAQTPVGCDLTSPYQIAVERYMCQPIPESEVDFAMDDHIIDILCAWGHPTINMASDDASLQIDLHTMKPLNDNIHKPINVCVVVDRSASMSEHRRMEKVKVAMKEFVRLLQMGDILSIVAYDDVAQVLLPAQRVTDKAVLSTLIDSIKLGRSTNMTAGMVAGFKEVLKNFDATSANRVILITDGVPNLGITEPDEICAQARAYSRKGIDISTVGVGIDLNFKLLVDIAREGRGLSRFIGDCDSIRNDAIKIFVEERNDILARVQNAVIEISYPKQFGVSQILGYEAENDNGTITIPLNNIPDGISQKVLVSFGLRSGKNPKKNIDVGIKLTYTDATTQKQHTLKRTARLLFSDKHNANVDMLSDDDVRTTYYTAVMALKLRKSLQEMADKRATTALQTLNNCLAEVERRLPSVATDKTSDTYTLYQTLVEQRKLVQQSVKTPRTR